MADYVLVVDLIQNLVEIQSRIDQNFDNYRKISNNVFVIRSTKTTSQGISETLFGEYKSSERKQRHAVFRFTAFWGFHDREIWEWLDTPETDG